MTNIREISAYKAIKRLGLNPIRRIVGKVTHRNRIPLTWCEGNNWGDALSPILVELLSEQPVVHVEGAHHDRYLAIGSILNGANQRAEIWGSGFICEDDILLGKPKAIHAVRGPLSRELLLRQDVDCPEVYGDPALLLPRFFNPEVKKQYSVGIIPHYIDKGHPWLMEHSLDPKVKILDIETEIEQFVTDVKSCDVILSSSLHGLICADSYGIPNAWIQLSEAVIGGDFKFRDYRRSLKAADPIALQVVEDTQLDTLTSQANLCELDIDLRKLMLACPFLSASLLDEMENAESGPCGIPISFQSSPLERFHK